MRFAARGIWSSGSKRAEIDAEVKAVAEILPGSELLAGEKATVCGAADRGATVGFCTSRRTRCTGDNPMFSGSGWVDGYPIFMTCIK